MLKRALTWHRNCLMGQRKTHFSRRIVLISNHSANQHTHRSLLFALLFLLLIDGCSSIILESRWRIGDAPIDGNGAAWQDTLTSLEDKKSSVGILNDEDNLYIRLMTTNRDLERQVIRQGLTFWFDRDGGEKKTFGIRFPLGMNRFTSGRQFRSDTSRGYEAQRRDSIYIPVNDVEIFGSEEEGPHRVSIANA
jgi:hypothetical protein